MMLGRGLIAAVIMVGGVACSAQASASPRDVVIPNLVGMYWADAEPQLRALGWDGALNRAPDLRAAPGDRNRILAQDPAAGEHLDADGVITLRFGA
ncbi:PASTA domain-containing protein [Mycolicibacterium stellerae]|uniref:PASTA domain-containing protein n=1 Tax=Mycolicibacterium stellerae TaxID=2358193 RepID=UPI000F0B4EDC|nr:PASTA domain-containing protein [Mycolicibacterium stellerae]